MAVNDEDLTGSETGMDFEKKRPRAASDARLAINTAADPESSTEDEDSEDAQGTIGVSIGRQQTRLLSPRTPAVEKAAAINEAGGFFGVAFDGGASSIEQALDNDQEDPTYDGLKLTEEAAQAHPPFTEEPTQIQLLDKPKTSLRDALLGRKRAESSTSSKGEHRQSSIFDSLPRMPKNFSIPSFFSASRDLLNNEWEKSTERTKSSNASSSLQRPSSQGVSRHSYPTVPQTESLQSNFSLTKTNEEAQATVGDLPEIKPLQRIKTRPQVLRRSTSDSSLFTQRPASRVSSLGDDSRFEDVRDQVNSRFKAIRDSLQDSNIKLPSISNLSVASLRPDFLRELSNSSARRPNDRPEQQSKSKDLLTERHDKPTKNGALDSSSKKPPIDHPHFTRALSQLEGDVVVLGGYRGSILRSAEPPHRQLWVPIKVGLNLRRVDLEVGLNEEDDERAIERVIPGGMLTHIGPVDMSRRLFKRLRQCDNSRSGKLRIHDYGYDWRLHPAHLSKQLINFLESLPCNKPGVSRENRGATVIAHSLGGLLTRHAVNQRPELFKGIVYGGVPKTCVNILGPLRNGDEVLISSRVLTAQVNMTIRTSFALLPLDGRCFFDKNTKEEYPVDFFDVQTWIDYRLSPCIARPLPPLVSAPKPTGISGYVSTVANALPSLPLTRRKNSNPNGNRNSVDTSKFTVAGGVAEPDMADSKAKDAEVAREPGNIDHSKQEYTTSNNNERMEEDAPSARTTVTISRDEAIAYLARTLATVKKFKQELAFNPAHHATNAYPPISVIFGKNTPTVFGAKVDGREGIKHADAYSDLAFASGDGVVLARAAMVPEGYRTARGGVVSSDRGHVTLLGDLEAIGQCLNAVTRERKRGVGLRTQ